MEIAGTGGGAGASSSSVIEPVPEPSASVAFTGDERPTVNVSSCSSAVSPVTATETDFDVSPGANVTVPLAAA